MAATTIPVPTSGLVTAKRTFWRAGLTAGAFAAATICATVSVARAAGVSAAVGGEPIPLLGFAQLTLVGALIGIGLARVLSTRARFPRSAFLRLTAALTALSI